MALTDTAIKNAKPAEKPRKLFDGGGLYLLVVPSRAKYWWLKYRFGGKEKTLSFGVYSEVTLAAARNLRDERSRSTCRTSRSHRGTKGGARCRSALARLA
ncbi:Arm DNA-binding domain-containing protein [Burkholderia orbicola]|uniref:Arm DNA-binding domain-containing protein n=1 Tax=Burkholderia orbicola TaxID=2978683 RepID=UPI0039A55F8F